ncbi:MAG TPA: glycosyl hydrolase 115 family protein [Niabella sp.]|nr:glycosyl hydrolase 115 family protein [Niabella sp.]HQW13740.1 glycosyl hydrolase 115 family protein [Niabella sp.]HQX19135.1 glycosyl hydrolase 115 family protein [Niabella sp.]HRB34286.1 glycosyl hydrolase 115 family protein [Niabella sp.]HRB41488.1 glycosyl hydrolase 115 family protein [Niabella sp.]
MKCWFIKIFMGMALAFLFPVGSYADVIFRENKELKISVITLEQPVVHTALEMFSKDYQKVFSGRIAIIENAQLYIGTLGMGSVAEKECAKKWLATLQQHAEGFVIYVKNDKLYVVGSDKRGTAYGILELSRMIGVSPWEWWADAQIEKKQKFLLKNGFLRIEHPSVKHRGIFINDEDWGLMPWSSKTFEPGLPTLGKTKGTIGPKTYSKIFELLLRLRANTIWPAMHEVTVPFYFTKGNKEAADKYGIIVSTSHCEPLMRNSATEWDIAGKGAYNYVTNREAILNYWTDRLKELKGSDNIYTIGLRGKHDGMMEGVKTQKEHKQVLTQVIKDERSLLSENINPDVRKVPQAFIPYKEVLDVYNDGLEVPEDVTLVWCDDNYGYIKHFPNEKERARKGGNGVYYHVSYWGRPHDYLWLATNHPAQLFTQMKRAYDNGAKDFWILNVGDIKPAEYLTELFLDMAWNINAIENNEQGLNKHLQTWLSREFGESNAASLLDIMNEYYRLAYIHKPEFMGATRTEEKDPKYKIVTDLPWSESQINKRMKAYKSIADKVTALSAKIPTDKQDAWFQLIAYPVLAAASMNDKCLFGQLARHGKADWKQSDEAYEKIGDLTQKYNSLNNGKWKGIMDFQPRKLSVFDKLTHEKADEAMVSDRVEIYLLNGNQYKKFKGNKPIVYGMGYERGAIHLEKGTAVVYETTTNDADSIQIELALAPNHPTNGTTLRYAIQVDNTPVQVVDYATHGRSEEWKENVLSNQAKRTTRHVVLNKIAKHTITIKALDKGVVVDQIRIW